MFSNLQGLLMSTSLNLARVYRQFRRVTRDFPQTSRKYLTSISFGILNGHNSQAILPA